jgi:apoptosis-inducing factor 3
MSRQGRDSLETLTHGSRVRRQRFRQKASWEFFERLRPPHPNDRSTQSHLVSEGKEQAQGPDLSLGLTIAQLPEGAPVGGHVNDKPVVLVRRGGDVFALGGSCTHYGGPLAEGIVVGDTIRCPWHHACFNLRTGEATCAPALDPVARWEVEKRGDRWHVTREIPQVDGATPMPGAAARSDASTNAPEHIVIVGAGAAGHAAAEMLRREGYRGSLTMIGAERSGPIDRPNLSKDYLAGTAEAAWIPLRPPEFFAQHSITLMRDAKVDSIDVATRHVLLADGQSLPYDRLLLATGAEPVRIPLPGTELAHVHYLRSLDDSDAISAGANDARRAVVLGASFIGLEVAASLRARGLEVHVVAPETVPLEKVLGAELGGAVRALHEQHGVVFHLGQTATGVDAHNVTLKNGDVLAADVVVIGVGVRPRTTLAEQAGMKVDRGISSTEMLETSVTSIFAAGDIARWPDARTGDAIRVEHWVVAERMGQSAARNMLREGQARERYSAVPFFWSAHYDMSVRYVGHVERWDDVHINGDLAAGDAAVAYRVGGRTLAVATVGRDKLALEVEAAMERGDDAALDAMLGITSRQ